MSEARAVALSSASTDVQAVTGRCTLMGWSIHESAGSAAVASLILRDGTSASGAIVAVLELAADGDDHVWFGPDGIRVNGGLYVDRVAGSTEGAVFIR